MIKECQNCRNWMSSKEATGATYNGNENSGQCRANPPNRPTRHDTKWVITEKADWCGQFKRKRFKWTLTRKS